MKQADWRVSVGQSTQVTLSKSDQIPLKWAEDAVSRAPRYIHDPDIVSGVSRAACPGCGSLLWPVLAGQPDRIRPTAHFRHVSGTPRRSCVVVSARLAAMQYMRSIGFIDLPRRRLSARSVGFTGQGYEGWMDLPPERVQVSTVQRVDHATAELRLADGRTLLVDLTGQRTAGEDGRALVTIGLSDPVLAEMDIEELRSRLRVLPPITWCSHWDDGDLTERARSNADEAARNALDAWTAQDEEEFLAALPPGSDAVAAGAMRRETLLHKTVKSILEESKRINTPGLHAAVSREAPPGYGNGWDDDRVELLWWTSPAQLSFADVFVERALGGIVPDLRGRIAEPRPKIEGGISSKVTRGFEEEEDDQLDEFPATWPETVLVEVAVTHRVDQKKLRRIEHLDVPTIELDLGSLGGTLTMEGLRRLVVDGLEGKRWIHHPVIRQRRAVLRHKMREHPEVLAYRAHTMAARRQQLLQIPTSVWSARYLEALTKFLDENARLDVIRRTEGPRHLEGLDEDSDEWGEVALAAEALEAHGLLGGAEHMVARTLVPRILSLKVNRGVGYAVSSAYQVVNAIMNSRSDGSTRWMSVYIIAARAFDVERHFKPEQSLRFRAWKDDMVQRIEAGDRAYLRPSDYDALLSILFPEMARWLAHGKGRA